MKAPLLKWLERSGTGFWFLPSVMAGMAATLALAMVKLDGLEFFTRRWAYTGGAEGARAMLATIAGSTAVIAGTVFPLTLVALSLASRQFGPRPLRGLVRGAAAQAVAGTLISTFVYCLLVLGTVRRAGEVESVPHLSVALGLLFALASLWQLIHFIHHASASIQAEEIIGSVNDELMAEIDRLFPERAEQGRHIPDSNALGAGIARTIRTAGRLVYSERDGYLNFMDTETLMALAAREDLVIQIQCRPGDYLIKGEPLAIFWPKHPAGSAIAQRIQAAFALGKRRAATQDIGFAIQQLAEIAVRALSAGVGDPFTALICIDRLGSALCRLAQHEMPSAYRFDAQDRLRLIAPAVTFGETADIAFDQIRRHAADAEVFSRLQETIARIALVARCNDDRRALREHADMIVRAARRELHEPVDREKVEKSYRRVVSVLQGADCLKGSGGAPPA